MGTGASTPRLHLDDAVAAYWPEFARNGKREITVREVLRHRPASPNAGSYAGEVRAMTDWVRAVRRIEEAKPRWPIGTVAYSPQAFGFILALEDAMVIRLDTAVSASEPEQHIERPETTGAMPAPDA